MTRIRERDTVRVPSELKEADDELAQSSLTVTERKWIMAATISAWVEPGVGDPIGAATQLGGDHRISASDYAKKGIHGLSKYDTVLRYYYAWLSTHSGTRLSPGDEFEIPERSFPSIEAISKWREAHKPPKPVQPKKVTVPKAVPATIPGIVPTAEMLKEDKERRRIDEIAVLMDTNPDWNSPSWYNLDRQLSSAFTVLLNVVNEHKSVPSGLEAPDSIWENYTELVALVNRIGLLLRPNPVDWESAIEDLTEGSN
jgi:hypothetical protein